MAGAFVTNNINGTESSNEQISALVRTYGDIGSLPNRTSDHVEGLFLETALLLDSHGLDLRYLVVIPEKDILGTVRAAKKRAEQISIALGISLLVFALASTFLITLPLRRLTIMMRRACDMDFSLLKSGYLRHRSSIYEISTLQTIFATMLARFVNAIEANRLLASKGRPSDDRSPEERRVSSSTKENEVQSAASLDREDGPLESA
ncbi:hypothetical protein HKX48_008188 [Thoreauomyces humboldtii]|nr:hypothetical protein HKX48_008188 [Thoreauomyces humboldtii]